MHVCDPSSLVATLSFALGVSRMAVDVEVVRGITVGRLEGCTSCHLRRVYWMAGEFSSHLVLDTR
jgi:hypothetical protein